MSDLPILPPLHEWYRVPVGATIPAGTPYAYQLSGAFFACYSGDQDDLPQTLLMKRWTPEPIAPLLPTEEGAQIIARTWGNTLLAVLTLTSGEWRLTPTGLSYDVASILEWAPLPADLVWHTR